MQQQVQAPEAPAPFITVFTYDLKTGEYTGPTQAQFDQLESAIQGEVLYIKPVCSTETAPPDLSEPTNQVRVFMNGGWSLQPDYRGQAMFSQIDGTPQEVTTIGALPSGFALTPPMAMQVTMAQSTQLVALGAAYQKAIQQSVSFTTKGGITETFDADGQSISNLANELLVYGATQTTPPDYYWVAADNTQVPFVYADLIGLAQVLGAQGWTAFKNLQAKKNAVRDATTLAAVKAITF